MNTDESQKTMSIAHSMVQHIGTKLVKRSDEPMTKAEYNRYRGWDIPKNEDANELVYLVEYEPDPKSKPNHPEHKGYISMSPKYIFDEAYEVCETFKDRLQIEHNDLANKTEKLMSALSDKTVPKSEEGILRIQLSVMLAYVEILNVRINKN